VRGRVTPMHRGSVGYRTLRALRATFCKPLHPVKPPRRGAVCVVPGIATRCATHLIKFDIVFVRLVAVDDVWGQFVPALCLSGFRQELFRVGDQSHRHQRIFRQPRQRQADVGLSAIVTRSWQWIPHCVILHAQCLTSGNVPEKSGACRDHGEFKQTFA
jgi:hypothetical protein